MTDMDRAEAVKIIQWAGDTAIQWNFDRDGPILRVPVPQKLSFDELSGTVANDAPDLECVEIIARDRRDLRSTVREIWGVYKGHRYRLDAYTIARSRPVTDRAKDLYNWNK